MRRCACSIRWASCWPARQSRRSRLSAIFENALVEDKYDGIRAQAHCSGGEVRIFSRTRDEITESFPELPDALAGLPEDAILDGEIVAWSYERHPASSAERPGAPLQRAAAAPGTKASQRETDAPGARWHISSSTFSTPEASCCWSVLSSNGRKFSMPCWQRQGKLQPVHESHREPGPFRIRRRRQRVEHARDSRTGVSSVNAAGTRSTV